METKDDSYIMFNGTKYVPVKELTTDTPKSQTPKPQPKPQNKPFLPKTWKEISRHCSNKIGYKINCNGKVSNIVFTDENDFVFTTEWTAEAFAKLKLLIDYRRAYNGNWTIEWSNPDQKKYSIIVRNCKLFITECSTRVCSMFVFKERALAQKYLDTFEKDIEFVYDSLYAN